MPRLAPPAKGTPTLLQHTVCPQMPSHHARWQTIMPPVRAKEKYHEPKAMMCGHSVSAPDGQRAFIPCHSTQKQYRLLSILVLLTEREAN